MRGGNSAPEDEVYQRNRWYTRRSFAPEACAWSMLREKNPSCVSAFKENDETIEGAMFVSRIKLNNVVSFWKKAKYIDLGRAKSEALVNNTGKQKKIKSCNAKRGGQ